MIARKRHDGGVAPTGFDQQVDDAPGIVAAIDIVAEMDDPACRYRVLGAVRGDRRVHLDEQVVPPVHIADCIDAQIVRALRVEEMYACRGIPVLAADDDVMQVARAVSAQDDFLLDITRA